VIRGACDLVFLHSLDKEAGLITLKVDKNRHGENRTITIHADFGAYEDRRHYQRNAWPFTEWNYQGCTRQEEPNPTFIRRRERHTLAHTTRAEQIETLLSGCWWFRDTDTTGYQWYNRGIGRCGVPVVPRSISDITVSPTDHGKIITVLLELRELCSVQGWQMYDVRRGTPKW
jgi:hypothetical protein